MSYYTDISYKVINYKHLDYYTKYVRYFKNCNKILDIGCSVGNFLFYCKLDGKEAVGLDIDKEAIAICKARGLKAININADAKLPFAKDSFDAINCWALIEHLTHERRDGLLKEIRRVLKPNGKLVITVPLAGSPLFWNDYTHKWGYTEKSLKMMAYDFNFKNIKINAICPVYVPGTNRAVQRFPFLLKFYLLFEKVFSLLPAQELTLICEK